MRDNNGVPPPTKNEKIYWTLLVIGALVFIALSIWGPK